jgi:GT2 family glycosyltransferase
MSITTHPLLAVVIPNRNGMRHLTYSLDCLADTTYQPRTTIMVDNCSSDESRRFVSDKHPLIAIEKNPRDLGFAGSVNVGIRWARAQRADYVAVYSNDIRVPEEVFEPAIAFMERHPDVAIVGYTELRRSEISMIAMPSAVHYSEVGPMLPGMLYLCRTTALDTVGDYDDFYYMYGEEVDLFSRLVRAGYRIVKTNVPVWHYVSGTSKVVRFGVAWYSYRNEIRFALKCGRARQILQRLLAVLYYATASNPRPRRHSGASTAGRSDASTGVDSAEAIREYRVHLERFRPGNTVLNLALYLATLFWNLIFLPHTLRGRFRDSQRVAQHVAVHRPQAGGTPLKSAAE